MLITCFIQYDYYKFTILLVSWVLNKILICVQLALRNRENINVCASVSRVETECAVISIKADHILTSPALSEHFTTTFCQQVISC